MAKEPLFQPEKELNPARTRWNITRSKIRDGSFFILCQPLQLGSPSNNFRSWQQVLQHVDFQEIISRAKRAITVEDPSSKWQGEIQDVGGRQRLAEAHIARASNNEGSSFESQIYMDTMRRMSLFMDDNANEMRRLSVTAEA
jgi:hypothetical protein